MRLGDVGPLGHHLGDDRLHGVAGERRIADQHLVRRGAERVDVAARADVALTHRLLGRHVGGCAEGHTGLGHATVARLAGGEGDPEIGDEGAAIMQEDVLRLDVAMDDAPAVGIVQGTATSVAMRTASAMESCLSRASRSRRDSPSI